ncbi:MAG: AtpZ/AtpI family protein [candidate division Zixibacteria bacterium]|nr:AtpZ/AtpI family protein [candidate division Zixibacteria bacterium]
MRRSGPEEVGRRLRPVGILTAIPFVLMVGPLVGYFVGHWLDRRWGTEPYLMVLFIALGFAASGREVWGLIKRASRDTNGD